MEIHISKDSWQADYQSLHAFLATYFMFSVCASNIRSSFDKCIFNSLLLLKKDDRKKLDYFFNSVEAVYWNHMWCFYLGICKESLVLTDITHTLKRDFFLCEYWLELVPYTDSLLFFIFYFLCKEIMEKQLYLGCENKLFFPLPPNKKILWTNPCFADFYHFLCKNFKHSSLV